MNILLQSDHRFQLGPVHSSLSAVGPVVFHFQAAEEVGVPDILPLGVLFPVGDAAFHVHGTMLSYPPSELLQQEQEQDRPNRRRDQTAEQADG